MATHRTASALVCATTAGALALGAMGSATAAEGPEPPVRNHSIVVDDISRLADASTELAEKSADSRGHSVEVRAARTRLDTVLQDAQRLADQLNEDSDRTVTADSARLHRAAQDLRTQLDELSGRRAPVPGEDAESATLTGSVTRSVTDIFKILGLDKLLGGLQQQPAAQPAAADRPARPAAEPADGADAADDQSAAQPKAPVSDPRPGDAAQPAADPQPAADAEQPADAPRQQPAEAPQQQGVPSLVNSVLSLPTVLLKALGL
ncbi:hypothetical protein [Streptomyces monomycini]|uniref:hypothetical protein n=1 Tax=Streptomyces monomycini TaxID=371720 RepID=UPI00067AB743|nr:hypothetical protein [Streptomyces monomycini]